VDAHGVVFRGGHWYVVGFDHARGEIRAYRLSRCTTDPVDVGEGSEPPQGFDAASHVQAAPWSREARARALVAFEPGAAALALASFSGAERAQSSSDGRVLLQIPVADEDAAAGTLLQYGPDAEVLEPASLRGAVADRLREIVGA
jgi:predicted DNA-binding transcriptional regulator YafY